jgi:hypothetical protein
MSDDTDARLSALEATVREQGEQIAELRAALSGPHPTPSMEKILDLYRPKKPADPMPLVTCPPEVLTQRYDTVDGEGNRTTISAEEFAEQQLVRLTNALLEAMPLVTCPPEVLTQRYNAADGEGNWTTISADEFAERQYDEAERVVAAYRDHDPLRLEWAPLLAFSMYLEADHAGPRTNLLAWLWHNSRRSAALVSGEGTDDVYGHRTWLAYFKRAEAAIRERMAQDEP